MLSGFREKDFLEQITILNEIAGQKDPGLLPDLLDLFVSPVGDKSVDYMVVNALNEILTKDEAKTVEHLGCETEAVQTLCVRIAGENKFQSATPALMAMAKKEQDKDKLFEILTALSHIASPDTAEIFRDAIEDSEPFICSLSIEMSGKLKDTGAMDKLKSIVDQSEGDDQYQECALTTWKAIEALAAMEDEEAYKFLVDKLHHRNPTARRIVTDVLTQAGEAVIPLLGDKLSSKDQDEQILAANILGFIRNRKGAGILVSELDKGTITDPNLRYAVFEALGRIGTMKGIICLMDALEEKDDLTLMAVVTGLNNHVNPGMIGTIVEHLAKGDAHSGRLAKAVIDSKSLAIFNAAYQDDKASAILMQALNKSKDNEVLEAFKQALSEMDSEKAQKDLASVKIIDSASTKKALAADDSRSMLALYRSILTEMGFEPLVGANGEEAFTHVDAGENFDVVITDMNMPVMDGLQLVQKLRETQGFEDVPIIMVTTESEASQKNLADNAGVTAFLTKPFKPQALKDKINELVK